MATVSDARNPSPTSPGTTKYIGSVIIEFEPVDSDMSPQNIAKHTLRFRMDLYPSGINGSGDGRFRLTKISARAGATGARPPVSKPPITSNQDVSLSRADIEELIKISFETLNEQLIQAKKSGVNCNYRIKFKIPLGGGKEEIVDLGEPDTIIGIREVLVADDEETKITKAMEEAKEWIKGKKKEKVGVGSQLEDVPGGHSRCYMIGPSDTLTDNALHKRLEEQLKLDAEERENEKPEPCPPESSRSASQRPVHRPIKKQEKGEYVILTKMRSIHTAKGPKELIIATRDALIGLLNSLFTGFMHRNITDESVGIVLEPQFGFSLSDFADLKNKDVKLEEGVKVTIGVLFNYKSCAGVYEYTCGIRDNRHLIPSPFSAKHIWSEEDAYYRKHPEPLFCPMFDIESLMWVMIWVISRKILEHSGSEKSISAVKRLILDRLYADEWERNRNVWAKRRKAQVAWHKLALITLYGERQVCHNIFLLQPDEDGGSPTVLETQTDVKDPKGDIVEDIPDFAPFGDLLRQIFIRICEFNTRYVTKGDLPTLNEFVGVYRDFIALFDAHIPKEETWDYMNNGFSFFMPANGTLN